MTLRAPMVKLTVTHSSPNVALSALIPARSACVIQTMVKVGAPSLDPLCGGPETM